MAYEFDVSAINYKLFDMKSKGRLELEQAITQGMEFFCDDRVAVVWLTTELMDRFNGRVDSEDFNGLASLPRQEACAPCSAAAVTPEPQAVP